MRGVAPIALLLLAAAVASAAGQVMYARLSTPVRAERGLGAASVARLEQGDPVTVSRREGRYYRVSVDGREGWVYFNKLAEQQPEDVSGLLAGAGGGGMMLSGMEAGGALRGLSPMAENYVEGADIPDWAVRAVEEMQGRGIDVRRLEQFQREGGLGEYAEEVSP